MIQQDQRANLCLLPLEPGIGVFDHPGVRLIHVILIVTNEVIVFQAGERYQKIRPARLKVEVGGNSLRRFKVGVGVAPDAAFGEAVK